MSPTLAAKPVTIALGIDRLLGADRRLIAGRRVGVVCNPASIDSQFRHTADRLVEDPDVTVSAIFGPQHGFRSDLQDNMIETPHARDARRRVPVYSLYSETREPTAEMLRDIDVLVIDLQDVGTRVYTYIYTMANCMRAAARHGVHVVVCDRPNPVGGEEVEGNLLDPAFASFVGQFPIPLRHGMTIGELARLFNDAFGIGCVARRRAARGLAAVDVSRRDRPAVGHPVAEPADARQRDRLSGRGAVRRHPAVGGARHDPSVRTDWRAVDRRRAAGRRDERARTAGRALPAGVLRADIPEAREADVRRVPAARRSIAACSARCGRRSN